MPEEVIPLVDLIDAAKVIICAIISGLVSWGVSRSAIHKEVKIKKLLWSREDAAFLNDEYSNTLRTVHNYVLDQSDANRCEALKQLFVLREKESSEVGYLLDDLYTYVQSRDSKNAVETVNEIIAMRRKIRCGNYEQLCGESKKAG